MSIPKTLAVNTFPQLYDSLEQVRARYPGMTIHQVHTVALMEGLRLLAEQPARLEEVVDRDRRRRAAGDRRRRR